MPGRIDYRQALGRFPAGVTVVTAACGGERFAMTASALTSVSLNPILLLVCFGHATETGRAVRDAGRFGLSVLGDADADVARSFAMHRAAGADQLAGHDVREGPHGVPLLARGLARCVCAVERIVRAGRHDVVVGEVEWIDADDGETAPLVYYDERFWGLTPFAEQPLSEERR